MGSSGKAAWVNTPRTRSSAWRLELVKVVTRKWPEVKRPGTPEDTINIISRTVPTPGTSTSEFSQVADLLALDAFIRYSVLVQ